MLDRQWPSWNEGSQSAVYGPASKEPEPEPRPHAVRQVPRQPEDRAERRVIQPRRVVALVLVLAGVIWALVRGLEFYGVNPVHLVYDLDQPPLLLMIVAGWLWFRSRVR
jgi:hypothetical protein